MACGEVLELPADAIIGGRLHQNRRACVADPALVRDVVVARVQHVGIPRTLEAQLAVIEEDRLARAPLVVRHDLGDHPAMIRHVEDTARSDDRCTTPLAEHQGPLHGRLLCRSHTYYYEFTRPAGSAGPAIPTSSRTSGRRWPRAWPAAPRPARRWRDTPPSPRRSSPDLPAERRRAARSSPARPRTRR